MKIFCIFVLVLSCFSALTLKADSFQEDPWDPLGWDTCTFCNDDDVTVWASGGGGGTGDGDGSSGQTCSRSVTCKDGGTVSCTGSPGDCSYKMGSCNFRNEHTPGWVDCGAGLEKCNDCSSCCIRTQ